MAHVSVRDKLVEAGLEVMHTQGFNGCSVQDITDAAGVPKGSFYNYFKSKEALAVAILGVYRGFADVELLADRSKEPLERMQIYFRTAARSFKAIGFQRGCLMGNLGSELSDSSELVRKALVQALIGWHQTLADVLREGQAIGDVNPAIDPDQAARFLVSAWEGTLLQMKMTKSSQPLDDFLDVAFVPLQRSRLTAA
jgi:TetR/AcrR family transcriptional regulator, transcriptional repressor for nem operon